MLRPNARSSCCWSRSGWPPRQALVRASDATYETRAERIARLIPLGTVPPAPSRRRSRATPCTRRWGVTSGTVLATSRCDGPHAAAPVAGGRVRIWTECTFSLTPSGGSRDGRDRCAGWHAAGLAVPATHSLFGRAPRLAVADAGSASRANERAAYARGVHHVALPWQRRKGRTQRVRAALKWRTGCEARISARKRRHGLRRCRYRGLLGMERWVGLGVIANKLLALGRAGPGAR
jgi:hypothetical protein